MTLWTPLFSFMVFLLVFAIGEITSNLTKGLFSGMILGAIVYIAGYWTGIIPTDSVASTGLPTVLGTVCIPMLITNLGTIISLDDMIKEWKTVAIALFGLVGLALVSFTVSIWLFGREYALCAAAPISGGTIAALLTQSTAVEAGRPELGAYAMLISSLQMFIGMPVSAFMLRQEAKRMLKSGELSVGEAVETEGKKKGINIRIFPEMPAKYQTTFMILLKLTAVAVLAYFVANLTLIPNSSPANYYLNPNIAYLIFGILFCELGFLEKNALSKAGAYGFVTITLYTLTPTSYTTLTPEQLLDMLVPIVGTLVVGAAGLMLFGAIAGKVLKVSPFMSAAISVCALMGYPATQIVTDDVTKALEDVTEEERTAVYNHMLPKMLVGGFTTVTIASVAFAGIICPMIF